MLGSFLDEYKLFINNRTLRIKNSEVMNNAEYIKLSNKNTKIYHEIAKHLPETHKSLLNEYESTINLMRAITDDLMYEHGLRDVIWLIITLSQ